MMTAINERIRWQLAPWHRDYIERMVRRLNRDWYCQELDRVKDDLRRCEVELFSLLPEVQFSEDGTEFIHPKGFTWTPRINREPRQLERIADELEQFSTNYLYIRIECQFGEKNHDIDPE